MKPEYEEWMRGHGLCARTIDQRVQFAHVRYAEWGTWVLPPHVLSAWLAGYSGWTKLTYFNHLSSIYKWLNVTDRLADNPMETLRRPHPPKPHPNPLTPSEVTTVFDGVTGHLRAWMLLAFYAGLRVHEVAKLRGEDIDQASIYVIGKGGQAATIPTHPELWELALTYPRVGPWFPSPKRGSVHVSADHISSMVADRFRSVGITSGSIHRLRATYGTTLRRAGVDIRLIQTLMRHSSLATTEHYLGVSEDERANAIRLLAA